MRRARGRPAAPHAVAPALVPALLVALATRVLPGGSRRARYRQEFEAELYGMPRGRQLAHALQLVASSWALRSATSGAAGKEGSMLTMLRSRPLLCLLGIRHRWEVQSTPDGDRYERCAKCGKDRMDYPWGLDPKGRNTIGMM